MDSNLLFTLFAILISVVVFGLLIVGLFLVIRDTRRQRGGFGINLSMPNCRHCGDKMPPVRVPANFRQAMWGGWTCPQCGLELDKWGEPIPNQTGPAKWKMEREDDRATRSSDERIQPTTDDIRRGGDIRD